MTREREGPVPRFPRRVHSSLFTENMNIIFGYTLVDTSKRPPGERAVICEFSKLIRKDSIKFWEFIKDLWSDSLNRPIKLYIYNGT